MAAHISTGVEYALHSLLFLADRAEEAPAPSTRDLAELQAVPPEFLAKLFTRLQKAGLTRSIEGVGGGVRLARPPAAIRVLDVVRAIDGDKPLFECREIRQRCVLYGDQAPDWATRGPCAIHAVMIAAQARLDEALAACTLADLAGQLRAKAPPAFGAAAGGWLDARAARRTRKRKEKNA
ncbi:MAG TPA: Rrf2 family transcriptional regulator [Novosphingobium sp.]|nr:Rrf2 family transcriptional regulator [Novosphingobium sp.]HZV09030.1 Rrf2 family transcriptional regulator [Novosphingobium sp.]